MTKNYRDHEFVRNPNNYDADKLSDQTGLLCEDESLTHQEFVEESDINYIAEKFMKTGEIKQVLHLPTQGDFEGIFDFQTAMNTIVQAKQEFMSLPAKIRSRFDHDPQKLLEFIYNPANRKEAEGLGLIEPKIDTSPDPLERHPALDSAPPSTESGDTTSRTSQPDKTSKK